MVVLEIQDRLLFPSRNTLAPPDTAITGAPLPIGFEPLLISALDVIALRADGPRLAIEWLAHLLWSWIIGSGRAGRRGKSIERREALFRQLIDECAKRGWTAPARIWSMFGGLPVESFPSAEAIKSAGMPVWQDWCGRVSYAVPLAVACCTFDGDARKTEWLVQWLSSVFPLLKDDFALISLSGSSAARLPGLLAISIANAPCPAAAFRAAWSDAEGARLEAQFLDFLGGQTVVRTCEAIIRVGLGALARGGNSSIELASVLADAIDEARYCYPERDPGRVVRSCRKSDDGDGRSSHPQRCKPEMHV